MGIPNILAVVPLVEGIANVWVLKNNITIFIFRYSKSYYTQLRKCNSLFAFKLPLCDSTSDRIELQARLPIHASTHLHCKSAWMSLQQENRFRTKDYAFSKADTKNTPVIQNTARTSMHLLDQQLFSFILLCSINSPKLSVSKTA